ncbi:MAG TPA: DinB family protein [Pyrinomonadaceae bacterium]|jgi:uncharacterized damage-inducible protein DinB|nr:DinB family protein [Pyrinomonadaceae bacterium]
MTDVTQNFIAKSRSLLRDDYLPKIERCLEELSDEDIWWRTHDEGNSIGNLLLHISGNARQWIVGGVGGAENRRERQQEFDQREGISRAELLDQLRRTLDDVEGVLARQDADAMLEPRQIQKYDVTVLEAIYHVVEHFAMHTGQIILLTKMLKRTDMKFHEHLKQSGV